MSIFLTIQKVLYHSKYRLSFAQVIEREYFLYFTVSFSKFSMIKMFTCQLIIKKKMFTYHDNSLISGHTTICYARPETISRVIQNHENEDIIQFFCQEIWGSQQAINFSLENSITQLKLIGALHPLHYRIKISKIGTLSSIIQT